MVVVYALCPANTKVFTLGRHRTNDVQLNDLVASKFHARITWQNVYWQNFFWLQVTSLPLTCAAHMAETELPSPLLHSGSGQQ